MWHKYDRDKIGVKILVDKMKEPSLKEKKIKEIYYCLKMASLNVNFFFSILEIISIN